MLDLIVSFLIRILSLFLLMLPIHFSLWIARRIGAVMCFLGVYRNKVAYSNLKAAFASEKTPRELKCIMKGACKNLTQSFVEILSLAKVNKRYIEKFISADNFERLEKSAKNPKGMVAISAHFGNWELSCVFSAMKGVPFHLLVREQNMKRLAELLNRLRESKGNVVVRKGMDIKNIFRILRNGKSIAILGDQNAGSQGELINFFGRPASTATGPFRFAQKSGAWIVPGFMHRVKGPYHKLVMEAPMIIKKGEDIIPYMREYNRLLEEHIRQYPDQWLWMHKRWKMTPVRKVIVLDDGEKEHLGKSLAASDQFKLTREAEGYTSEQTEVNIVQIRFKNKKIKSLFNILSPFFTSRCQGCMKCLKWALEHKSYEDVISQYADIVISFGSTLSSVDKLLRIENNAQSLQG